MIDELANTQMNEANLELEMWPNVKDVISVKSRARAEHSFEEDSEEVARGVCNIGTKNSFKIQDGRPRFERDLN